MFSDCKNRILVAAKVKGRVQFLKYLILFVLFHLLWLLIGGRVPTDVWAEATELEWKQVNRVTVHCGKQGGTSPGKIRRNTPHTQNWDCQVLWSKVKGQGVREGYRCKSVEGSWWRWLVVSGVVDRGQEGGRVGGAGGVAAPGPHGDAGLGAAGRPAGDFAMQNL